MEGGGGVVTMSFFWSSTAVRRGYLSPTSPLRQDPLPMSASNMYMGVDQGDTKVLAFEVLVQLLEAGVDLKPVYDDFRVVYSVVAEGTTGYRVMRNAIAPAFVEAISITCLDLQPWGATIPNKCRVKTKRCLPDCWRTGRGEYKNRRRTVHASFCSLGSAEIADREASCPSFLKMSNIEGAITGLSGEE